MQKKLKILIPFVFFIVGFGVGAFTYGRNMFCDTSAFKYINSDLVCADKPTVQKHSYITLKHQLESFIQQQKEKKIITDVSLYFRDLKNGPTLGINEYAVFSPASLFKLPVLFVYLNLEENNPELGNTKLVYQLIEDPFVQTFFPTRSVEENTPYSVDEFLRYLIKYSDNRADYVLLQYLKQTFPNENFLGETLSDLGIIDTASSADQIINVKSYASMFIQLFNSSFFNKKETSEKALAYLADTDFNQGLVSGLPAGVTVAHKFGERSDFGGGTKQLHDCGIVYYPDNPYLLCVMTRGTDFNDLSKTIGAISKMFYQEFDSRKL